MVTNAEPAVAAGTGIRLSPGTPADSASNLVRRSEIIDSIRKDQLVVVSGTGVSMQSVGYPAPGTDTAGWSGLLQHGVNHCLARQFLTVAEAAIVNLQIQSGTTEYLLEAAQKIHDCLDKQVNARYFWMKESIGQLRVKDPRLIQAIQGLGGLVATLNYDSLLQEVTGRPPLHWRQQNEITRLIRDRSKDFILHLHGHWEQPASIILDRRSYEEISKDTGTQDLLHTFARFQTILFVGCGQTFGDPNFQALLGWAHGALEGMQHRHFVLCQQSDEPQMCHLLQPHGYLAPLVYGDKHADLAPYLEALSVESGVSAAATNPPVVTPSKVGGDGKIKLRKPGDVWKMQSQR